MLQELGKAFFVNCSGQSQSTVAIYFTQPFRLDEIIKRRIGRPGIKCDETTVAVLPGDICDTAQVQHRGVISNPGSLQQRGMIGC